MECHLPGLAPLQRGIRGAFGESEIRSSGDPSSPLPRGAEALLGALQRSSGLDLLEEYRRSTSQLWVGALAVIAFYDGDSSPSDLTSASIRLPPLTDEAIFRLSRSSGSSSTLPEASSVQPTGEKLKDEGNVARGRLGLPPPSPSPSSSPPSLSSPGLLPPSPGSPRSLKSFVTAKESFPRPEGDSLPADLPLLAEVEFKEVLEEPRQEESVRKEPEAPSNPPSSGRVSGGLRASDERAGSKVGRQGWGWVSALWAGLSSLAAGCCCSTSCEEEGELLLDSPAGALSGLPAGTEAERGGGDEESGEEETRGESTR